MRGAIRLSAVLLCCFTLALIGVPIAYAGCMDNAGDAVLGFLSGGLTVAACQMQELVAAIQNFIATVSALANNVTSNAKSVANAAVGAVNASADDVSGTVGTAQRDLASAVAEAMAMSSPQLIPAPAAVNISRAASATSKNIGVTVPKNAILAATSNGKKPPATAFATAPILNQADLQRLHADLVRGTQQLSALKASVDQNIAGHINSALQQARNQATSHLADAADIVKTALLAPINALLSMLNDLVTHPTRLLDPIATINAMVKDISKNIVATMSQINDDITKDAVSTLTGIEPNVQAVQASAQKGDRLLSAMRLAHQEKTKAAVATLESLLNTHAPITVMQTAFRFAPVQGRLNVKLKNAVMPYQSIASKLQGDWGNIKALHLAAKPRSLDVHAEQMAQTELDQMFRGKSPADVARARQNLLNEAKSKYGSDPKLMASIEQSLDSYMRTHGVVVAQVSTPAGHPLSPNRSQMLSPQPTLHVQPLLQKAGAVQTPQPHSGKPPNPNAPQTPNPSLLTPTGGILQNTQQPTVLRPTALQSGSAGHPPNPNSLQMLNPQPLPPKNGILQKPPLPKTPVTGPAGHPPNPNSPEVPVVR